MKDVFANCRRLKNVTFGSTMTTIPTRMFRRCNTLASITIPSNITSIEEEAFVDCYALVEIYNYSSIAITKGATDNGYIGGKSKILGLTIKNFVIGNDSETININIENAGAVGLVYLYEWNKYNNVLNYRLMGKQSCDYISFDNSGSKDYSIKSESSYRYILYKHTYDSNYSGGFGYFFTFPIKNASLAFYAETTDNELIQMASFNDDVNIGETYEFLYDFEEDKAYWYDMTKSNSKAIERKEYLEKISNDNDRIIYDYEGHTISIQ